MCKLHELISKGVELFSKCCEKLQDVGSCLGFDAMPSVPGSKRTFRGKYMGFNAPVLRFTRDKSKVIFIDLFDASAWPYKLVL